MTTAAVNGIQLSYRERGEGPLVVLVMGTGAKGNVWDLHQVPALVDAGYRVVSYDARGLSPVPGQTDTFCPEITVPELVDDLAALIDHLGGPAHVVGTSLGARVVQELALTHPARVRKVVALAGHARLDKVGELLNRGEAKLFDDTVRLPNEYHAAVEVLLNLSPATLRDPVKADDWLAMLEFSVGPMSSGERGQLRATARMGDRREAYRDIDRPLLVVSFADDLIIPPRLGKEVADAVPGAEYAVVPDTGHFGYLEQPEAVNRMILDFLGDT